MTTIQAVAIGWIVIGAGVSFVMARTGRDLYTWWAIGALFGPFSVALALHDVVAERRASPHVLHRGQPGRRSGTDLLVGIDGSREARAALEWALRLHAGDVGRVTLATVVPFGRLPAAEAAGSIERLRFDEAARLARPYDVASVLVEGNPADALVKLAKDGRYDLVVIGSRGRGRRAGIVGSAARRLASGSAVPVLMATDPPRRDAEVAA
jgi:nucleotide-binding universal stress UspA family protein